MSISQTVGGILHQAILSTALSTTPTCAGSLRPQTTILTGCSTHLTITQNGQREQGPAQAAPLEKRTVSRVFLPHIFESLMSLQNTSQASYLKRMFSNAFCCQMDTCISNPPIDRTGAEQD